MARDRSGFCLQLRLLLWKNYTLKKRHPFVFLLEVVIPLTLFFIFILIRKNQRGVPIQTVHFNQLPLPSAGIIPVVQTFCSRLTNDVYTVNNTKLTSVFEQIQIFVNQTDAAFSQLTPDSLEMFAPFVNQSVSDWSKYNHSLLQQPDIPIQDVIKDIAAFKGLLQTKYNLKSPEIDALLGSSLDVSQIIQNIPDVLGSLADKGDWPEAFAAVSSLLLSGATAQDAVMEIMTSPTIMRELLCTPGMAQFIIPEKDGETTEMVNNIIQRLICQSDLGTYTDFVKDFATFVDKGSVSSKLGISEQIPTNESAGLHVNRDDMSKFTESLTNMWKLIGSFPAGACCALDIPRHASSCSSKAQAPKKKNPPTLEEKYAGIIKYMALLQPTLCFGQSGVTVKVNETKDNATDSDTIDEDHYLTISQKKTLRVLAQMLYNNPKILYAPNNSVANRIIQKVNTSFALYGNISYYAKHWLNSSAEVRKVLLESNVLNLQEKIPDKVLAILDKILDDLDNVACSWLAMTSGLDFDVFRGFRSEAELEDYFLNRQYHDNVTVVAGLVFENLNASSPTLPPHFRYKIRQNATLNPPTNLVRNPIYFPSPGSNNLMYYVFGFVWIQDAVERAVIDLQAGHDVTEPGSYLHRMPYPCWLWDSFVWLIQHVMPLCLMLSWIYTVAMLVQKIVYEKEKGLKEVMKMMGLTNAVHWCAWFITAFVQMTITVAALTLMLCCGNILTHSDPWIIFLFLELFVISCIAMSFLISSLYSKAKLAAACAGIFYMLTYVPYIYVTIQEDLSNTVIPAAVKKGVSILSTSALGLGGKYFLFYEMDGVGVQWSNISQSPREKDEFSLQFVLIMMVVDSFVYFLLAWYIENVHPGTYGLSKPWYFPILPSYWCSGADDSHYTCSVKQLFGINEKYRSLRDITEDDDELILRTEDNEYAEAEDDVMPAGVKVENLTKVYVKNAKPAVNNLSMTLYENQITSFLGHNGAGKTTTMNLLTGLFPPTSGDAFVNGASIRTDMETIRQNLGICPQHNILFESLTVEEHLWFYARLKGMKEEDIYKETSRMLKDLGITKKRAVKPSCLSGGMQRKLSVAMAFVGGSKTVILDEPTAGVDPYSRRSIWNLLNKYKKGRTILLSTHHMDEAEVLGDRIAIISNGELKCSGSPTFLKTLLGNGQHLHIVRCDTTLSDIAQDHPNAEILQQIKNIVPETTISSSTQSELHLFVPVSGTDKIKMADVLDMLQYKAGELGIKSYGVTDTGLEDVFVQITEEAMKKDAADQENSSTYHFPDALPTYDTNDLHLRDLNDRDVPGREDEDCSLIDLGQSVLGQPDNIVSDSCCKHLRHFKALLAKRFLYTLRNRKGIISQIILPAIFVSISMTIALSAPQETDPPQMTMSPSQYFNATQPRGNFIPYTYKKAARVKVNRTSAGANTLVRTFQMPSGVGATCVLKSPFHSEYDADMIKHLDPNTHHFELYEKYFNENCSGVFTPGVTDQMFVPSISTINVSLAVSKANHSQVKYYPLCKCMSDSVGFACSKDGYVEPPSRRAVTRDVLQDISLTEEEDFYLHTTDIYRLHRYGGFSFGTELPYVPEYFGKDEQSRTALQRLAVKKTTQVRFNQKGYHSIPVYVNTLNNAILRANLPKSKGNPSAYGITLINHPMKKTNNLLDTDYIQGGTDVLMAIFIIIAMAFVPASFVVFLVHERSIKAKHLQFVSGVNPVVYWISNYVWDMCNYMIPAVCIVAILLVFNIPAYVAKGNFEAVVSLFLLYGWSITPMMYPATFLFRESSIAYILLIVFNLFTGITCVVSSFLLEQFSFDKELNGVNQILKKVFLIFPNYCLGNGLMGIALNQYKNEYYSHTGFYDKMKSPLEWDITGRHLLIMGIEGFVFFVITLLCEYRFFIKCRKQTTAKLSVASEDDDDVEAERERTLHGCGQGDLLRIKNLTKVYKTKKRGTVTAVDGLTFSIPRGECFGLLGVNGAGKTTTFKMLTGDIKPTSGDAKLESHSIRTDLGRVQQHIGYCPQFDALFTELTPTEHLKLYCRLRGIHPREEQQVVQHTIDRLSLQKYARQPAGTLSGGNKRKLSTAISLIGNPSLIFMDEPTTGMDPYSRRFLWDTIKSVVKDGTSVLFTSHSMEECEYLCSRLSIMVNGQLKCLGCKQHLKNKFGDGYTLTVLMMSEHQMADVTEHLTSSIPDCSHTGRSHRTLLFEVKVDFTKLGDIYRIMEHVCQTYHVKDYSLSQNTLDNVFVKFAKHQTSSEDDIDEEAADPEDEEAEDDSLESALDNMRGDDDEPLIELSPEVRRLEVLC